MPNFINISQTVAEIWRFNGFLKWHPSATLDLLDTYLYYPQRLLEGIYHLAKFGWNRCSGFDNMKVFIFGTFGLKMPIHAHKIGVLGNLTP